MGFELGQGATAVKENVFVQIHKGKLRVKGGVKGISRGRESSSQWHLLSTDCLP